jgi:hypothetical protein
MLLESADALVLGRATYEVFAALWPGRTGELADRINSLPKYVASHTLTGATWNSQILPGDAVEAAAELKESGEGTLLKYGTGSFSRALLEGGQLDELHLWMYHSSPVRGAPPAREHDHTPRPGRGERGRQWRRRADLQAEAVAPEPLRQVRGMGRDGRVTPRRPLPVRLRPPGCGRAVPGMMSENSGGSVR